MPPHPAARQSSARETAVSLGVLLVLAATASWLAVSQAHFSPAVTVATTAAAAAARVSTASPGAPTSGRENLLSHLPAGLRAMGGVEAFTPDTLSDKIDGKAELYLSAGFVGLRCQRLAPDSAPAGWFEVFIYDMGRPENAFAVFSSQKRHVTREAQVGDYSYVAGNQLCLVHGQYYLELVGADAAATTLRAAEELARGFVGATTVARHANVAKDEALFPAQGLVPGSVMLLSADVFGFDQLTNTWVARYADGSDTVTLFLSRRENPETATKLGGALRDFFVNDCGGTETPKPAGPAGSVVVDSGGSFDGMFVVGAYVAGVHQAPSRDAAVRWMERLELRLKTAAP